MKYKVISFDIFQTLVDVNKRIPDIWRGILKDGYSEERALQGAKAIVGTYPEIYEKAIDSEQFYTMEEVYNACTRQAVRKLDFSASPRDVAYNLMYQHAKAPFYDEVLSGIKALHQKCKIILSSDSNHLMVDGLLKKFDYDAAFISDDLQSYKGDKKGRFFNLVLSALDAEPEEIIHIGDSPADVEGAQKAGIAACWINRNKKSWKGKRQPDYIIENLNQLEAIL